MRRKRFVVLAAIICCGLMIIALISFNRDQTRTWDMEAYWISKDGTCGEVVPFTVKVSFRESEEDEVDKIAIQYQFPEGDNYLSPSDSEDSLADALEYKQDEIYGRYGFSYGISQNAPVSHWYAVDLEKEYIVFQWGDNTDSYLFASTNPETEPTDILTHFVTYIDKLQIELSES